MAFVGASGWQLDVGRPPWRGGQFIPPARVDLVDEVLVGVGRRDLSATHYCPPIHLVHQLAYRVKRVHLGEVRMRGPNREVVDVIRYYRDKMRRTAASTGSPGTASSSASTRRRTS